MQPVKKLHSFFITKKEGVGVEGVGVEGWGGGENKISITMFRWITGIFNSETSYGLRNY